MKRLIIVGSPRTNGRSAHLAEMLFEANIDEYPEDELFLVPLSEIEVGPCIACDACREMTPVILKGDDGGEIIVERHRCIFDDDMQTLYDLIDDADEVTLVSPVYFSGAPAQLKCLLDRLQPYYWARNRGHAGAKKPATLHVIGEGGDPHGHDALVSEVRAALAVAGFRLERVLDWVGKIDENGEITAEAKETRFSEEGKKERPKLNVTSPAGKTRMGKADQPKPSQTKAGARTDRSKASKAKAKTGEQKSSQAKAGAGAGKQKPSQTKAKASQQKQQRGNSRNGRRRG